MIDKWILNDLTKIYENHSVSVMIDNSGDAKFLLKILEKEYTVYQTNSEIDELHVKYLIEKNTAVHDKYLIYTQVEKKHLKFIREYCEIYGCLEIQNLSTYIKEKVHQTYNLNLNLTNEELIAAAKISIGKDKSYWSDICHKGAAEIFDLKRELLPFIHAPKHYEKEKDDQQLLDIFYKKVNELLRQQYQNKPPQTLANEIVEEMLRGLVTDSCNPTLFTIYQSWLDSLSYKDSFFNYLNNYHIPQNFNIWTVNINHPFRNIDEWWLNDIGKHLNDQEYITQILPKLKQRSKSKQANALNIIFWDDVIKLLVFDPKNIAYLSSTKECVEFYIKHFSLLDTSIRNLYTEFLNNRTLLEPFQELYKEYVAVLLDKWFYYWDEYTENQTGLLQYIFDEANDQKIAIIVGDGVSYEIAEQVAIATNNSLHLTKNFIFSDFPSETENNMSRIYMDNGNTEKIHKTRETYIVAKNKNSSINFVRLDEVNDEPLAGQILICTYKDVDDLGEKLQQKALKYFSEIIGFFSIKISQLISNGYEKVYLISDHGFVLTGLLDEADKISITISGEHDKSERYIRTKQKQTILNIDLIEIKNQYDDYKYLYFAKNMSPFKTTGLYGYSHGGLTPQELITPFFCWERSKTVASSLSITISNKAELKNSTGQLFSIVLEANEGTGDLFSMDRKISLVFFSNGSQVNKSDIITIQKNNQITKEYSFDGYQELDVHVLDASTKQQLDKTIIKRKNDRDLGGLL